MIVLVAVMMVTASAAGTVLVMGMIMVVVIMLVVVRMIVAVRMPVVMAVRMGMVVAVRMAMIMVMMPMVVIAHMGAALRPEGALHRSHRAALTAGQFRKGRVVLDVEGIIRELGKPMVAAEMPGEAHEAQGIFGPDLEQPFGRSLHLHEPPVLEPQGIAVVDRGLHVEIEMNLGAALGLQPAVAAVAGLMVERDDVDDAVGLYGGLADDGGDAGHGTVSVCDRVKLR